MYRYFPKEYHVLVGMGGTSVPPNLEMKNINALYDLGKASPSFDALSWLVNIADTAVQSEHDCIKVAFKPGPDNGFKSDSLSSDPIIQSWMFEHIVKPAVKMIGGEVVEYDENQEYIEQSYLLGDFVRSVKAELRGVPLFRQDFYATRLVDKSFGEKDLVTITLRNSEHWPECNSNFSEWLKFAKFLKKQGFTVVFVPDTENAFQEIPGYQVVSAATFNLNIRQALYGKALMNFAVNSGPCHLLYFSQSSYCVFKQLTPDTPHYDEIWWEKSIGLKKGDQYPWAHQAQRLTWTDDTYENLVLGYKELILKVREIERKYILQPQITINTSEEKLSSNCKFAVSRNLPEILHPAPAHNKHLVIAAGGPSLKFTTNEFPADAHIIAVNNSYKFLLERDIVPDYMAMFDARELNSKFVDIIDKHTHFLIASQCHPKVFVKLKKARAKVTLWHSNSGPSTPKWLNNDRTIVSGGSTIGMRCLNLGVLMGYRTFHLFGFDSCWIDNKVHHAYDQPENDTDDSYIVAIGEGELKKEFRVATWMARQYEDFKEWINFHGRNYSIIVYGEGLIPYYVRIFNNEVDKENAA
jgi:hypothetical protein